MFPLAAIFDIGNKLIDKLIPDPTATAVSPAIPSVIITAQQIR